MVEALDVDMHAASAIGPRRSLLNTWTKYHLEWCPFPVTKEILTTVAAMFQEGKYQRFPQYLSGQEEHIRRGRTWHIRWTAFRDIGPVRQSEDFSVRDIAEVDAGFYEVVDRAVSLARRS